jgi:predicted O-methyltransferase YrrM
MSPRTLNLSDALASYVLDNSLRESAEMAALRAETDLHPRAVMRSSAEQIQFLALLLKLMGARRVIEVGVFTGYGTLGLALALPDDGELWALDQNAEFAAIGQPYWEDAGVHEVIKLRIAPALESLDYLLRAGQGSKFDMIYVDADKENYDAYVERGLRLLRTGGLIALDNVLWSGKVIDPTVDDAPTRALRALNAKLAKDPRVDISLLPLGDGVTLLRKR